MILAPSHDHFNDQEICRLLDALCEVQWDRLQERVRLLCALGRRYILLAIARQQNLNIDVLACWLVMEGEHLLGRLSMPPRAKMPVADP